LANLKARKALGRAHLEANHIEEALRLYAKILCDDPGDVDSYLVIGDCYLAEGDGETAYLLYSHALDLRPEDAEIQQRLRLAKSAGYAPGPENPIDPSSVANLLQHLAGRDSPVSEEEVQRAADLLETIIASPQPAQVVAERLAEIDELLPALLELNIRQARADGRPDLAKVLQELLKDIQQQVRVSFEDKAQREALPASGNMQPGFSEPVMAPGELRVLFLAPQTENPAPRCQMLAEIFSTQECQATIADTLTPELLRQSDVVLVSQPHRDPRIIEGMAACAAARVPVILDLEMDFERLPVDRPDYECLGLGTAARSNAYASALLMADQITVASEAFAAALCSVGYQARWMPDGWSEANCSWKRRDRSRHTINLGWVGAPGQVEDVFQIRRMVIRVMREFPYVNLVIGGDSEVYHLFDNLPESRRLFLPAVNFEDYQRIFGHIDVLLVPLRNTSFHRSLSDLRLLEAGICRAPWLASPIPAFVSWEAGGLIATSPDEWHTNLRQLIVDQDLRAALGQAGHQKAQSRRINRLRAAWIQLLREVAAGREAVRATESKLEGLW